MIEVRKDRRVKVYGVCFNGLNELLNVALSHKQRTLCGLLRPGGFLLYGAVSLLRQL